MQVDVHFPTLIRSRHLTVLPRSQPLPSFHPKCHASYILNLFILLFSPTPLATHNHLPSARSVLHLNCFLSHQSLHHFAISLFLPFFLLSHIVIVSDLRLYSDVPVETISCSLIPPYSVPPSPLSFDHCLLLYLLHFFTLRVILYLINMLSHHPTRLSYHLIHTFPSSLLLCPSTSALRHPNSFLSFLLHT